MKNNYVVFWLLGLTLALWPTWGWAAPAIQPGGSIPTPTVVPITLTVDNLYTIPSLVTTGEPFELNFRIRNSSANTLENLAVTIRDNDADWALTSLDGSKTIYFAAIAPDMTTLVSHPFIYASEIVGNRQLLLILEYTYLLNGERVDGAQTTMITLRLVAPTPTPTVTLTPTPMNTFTPTPNPAATQTAAAVAATETAAAVGAIAATTVANQATAEANQLWAVNAAVAATLTAAPASSPPTTTRSLSNGQPLVEPAFDNESVLTEVDRINVIVELDDIPTFLQLGQLFTMTLTVRNISHSEIDDVVIEWRTQSDRAIVPSGIGFRWFVGAIPGGATQSITRSFYVDPEATPGISTNEVAITYQLETAVTTATDQINLLVQAPELPTASATLPLLPADEPAWLRFLQALFGLFSPTDDPK